MTLNVTDTTFGYDGTHVLKDVSFQVDRGELLGLLGPNGSGKSTLLQIIDTIQEIEAGEILLDGVDLQKSTQEEVARHVGYLPQTEASIPSATVFDTVLLGRQPYFDWRPSREDRAAVEQVLEELGISDLAMREVPTLSGGQRRMVLLARALVQAEDALLLDEPTSGLDLKHQHEVMRRVRDGIQRSELAGIVALHDLDLATRFCDRFAFLKDGELRAVGGDEVLTEQLIQTVYEVPVDVFQHEGQTHIVPEEPSALDSDDDFGSSPSEIEGGSKPTAIADGNGENQRAD